MAVILLGFESDRLSHDDLERVQALAPDYEIVVTRDKDDIVALLPDIEIAVRDMPRDLLMRAPRLRWFQQWGAGADWLLRYPEAIEHPFLLTNASGVHAIPISEHIIGMLLMFSRTLHLASRAQQRREWWAPAGETMFELAGKRMLLVGVGAIGQRTAMLASALGMTVEGIRRDPTRSLESVAAMYGQNDLRARLPHADVVVLTLPLNTLTRGLMSHAEFRAMKPTAYLINIARGGIVDERALVEALREGWIAGAGLDVFEEEPLPAQSPLWEMENVIITAHYAGATPHYDKRALGIFLDNLKRYTAGEPLRNLVDKYAGY